jgi:DNA-binding YbaB/EbfC family protein
MSDTPEPQNLQSLFETAQRVQQQISKVQDELAEMTVEGSAGGGMVTVVVNGRQQLLSIAIEREVVDPEEVGMLQDLVVAAVNQALGKAAEMAQHEMAKLTGQMNINLPNLF